MAPIHLDPGASSPLYLQLQRSLRRLIQQGEWGPGVRLPAVPEMAHRFAVHRLTVLKALAGLKRTGWVQTVPGRGSFVADRLPEAPLARLSREEHVLPFQGSDLVAREHELGPWLGETLGRAQNPSLVSFSAGFPPPDLLPGEALRRHFSQAMKRLGPDAWVYAHPEGHPPLLDGLAAWLEHEGKPIPAGWGVRAIPGAQAGLALVLESLTVPGEHVLVESPCYVGVLALLRAMGREAVPVPVDRNGLDPERLESALQRGDAKLLFTVPNFHNPTGMTLSKARRERILAMTRQHGVTLVEDDAYGDLRFSGAPVPSFRSMAEADHVVHVGTFSKVLAAGLRLGYVIARQELLQRLAPVQEVHAIALPTLSQAAVAGFLDSGGYHRHVLRLRRALRERRDAMLEGVRASFPEGTEFTEPKGGMHLWVMLPEDCSALELHREALAAGLGFAPGPLFFADGRGGNCLRLNFSTHSPARIREAIPRLGRLIHASTAAEPS